MEVAGGRPCGGGFSGALACWRIGGGVAGPGPDGNEGAGVRL